MVELTYRRLSASDPDDVSSLQSVLEAAPGYYRIIGNSSPKPDESLSELKEVPEGHSLDDKFNFLIEYSGEPVGCLDILKGYPSKEIAFIGLLLFAESHQGRNLGQQVLKYVIKLAENWACSRLRIAVVDTNERALAFWKREGFTELSRKHSNKYIGNIVVLERHVKKAVA